MGTQTQIGGQGGGIRLECNNLAVLIAKIKTSCDFVTKISYSADIYSVGRGILSDFPCIAEGIRNVFMGVIEIHRPLSIEAIFQLYLGAAGDGRVLIGKCQSRYRIR